MDNSKLPVICQKGGTDFPQHYRPIAFLSVVYKLLASIIQARISSTMDEVTDNNQCGFRKCKSTSHLLFMLRRTTEIQQEAAPESRLLLLDWEKAFDKASQSRMVRAISRLGVPENIINMVQAIYPERNYVIIDKDITTEPRIQKTGIRQGCPLPPYPFIMLMTVIMHDVEAALTEQGLDTTNRDKLHKQVNGKFSMQTTQLLWPEPQKQQRLCYTILNRNHTNIR